MRKLQNILELLLVLSCLSQWALAQQTEQTVYSSYKVLADELRDRRSRGDDEPRQLVDRALRILDESVLSRLNASPAPKVGEINLALKHFLGSEQPFGEDYTLQTVPAKEPPAYVLTCNLGQSGPSAIRLYERKNAPYHLLASIDQFSDPDFDDAYLQTLLFPPSAGELFVLTVSGRTDSWSTGTFTLWAVAEGEVRKAWVAEALPFSSYELVGSELRLEFCEQQDEEKPEVCRQRVRERYTLSNGELRRVDRTMLPPAEKKP